MLSSDSVNFGLKSLTFTFEHPDGPPAGLLETVVAQPATAATATAGPADSGGASAAAIASPPVPSFDSDPDRPPTQAGGAGTRSSEVGGVVAAVVVRETAAQSCASALAPPAGATRTSAG